MGSYLNFYYTCTYVEDSNNVDVEVLNLRALVDYLEDHGLTLPGAPDDDKLDPPCIHGGTPTKQQVLDYVVLSKPFDIAAKRATGFVDSFRYRFRGYKRLRSQRLEWPRTLYYYGYYYEIDSTFDPNDYFNTTIPDLIVFATAQTLVLILGDKNPLGDWITGGIPTNLASRSFAGGAASYTYFDRDGALTQNLDLECFLEPVLKSSSTSAVR